VIAQARSRFALLTPRERTRWLTLLPIGVATSVLEALAAATVYALVGLLSGSGLTLGRSLRWLQPPPSAVTVAAIAAGLHLVKNAVLLAAAAYRARLAGSTAAELSSRTLKAYLHAPYVFHLRRNSSDLTQSLTAGVPALMLLCDSAATLVTEALVVAGLVALLGAVAPVETLVASVVILGPLVPFVRFTRGAHARLGARNYDLERVVRHGLQQAFGAIKEVQVFGRESHFYDAIARDEAVRARILMRQATLENVPRLLTETAFVLGVLALVILMDRRGEFGRSFLPFVGLYAYAGLRIIPAAHRIVFNISQIRYGLAASASLADNLDAVGPATDGRDGVARPLSDALRFEHVSYAYDGREPVLRDVDLTVQRGESVGIMGATGAGKSTLVDLTLGLLAPTSGRILADDQPISTIRRGWQRQIGYVPQAPFLLDDTLEANIAFGVAPEAIDRTRVRDAARAAQLDTLVSRLPQGLATPIGERGVALSGGERQRLSIARALYIDPAVLIFDEATSALDAGTERALTDALDALKGTRTMIIIAHRDSTVAHCDRIIALEDGRIAQ
jgi:ABC-type multidrug transport system fused ATPase/permease subunit